MFEVVIDTAKGLMPLFLFLILLIELTPLLQAVWFFRLSADYREP